MLQKNTRAAARTEAGIALPLHQQPLASIIIPAYNKAEFTLRCLTAIAAHPTRVPYEVIVVNDASTDATATMVAGIPNLRVVTNATNLGYLRSCNAGAAQARGRYVVLLNNDTEVQPEWLEALVDCAETDPGAGVVGAKLIFHDGTLQEAGGIIWADGTGLNYGRNCDPDRPEFNFIREVDYCSGACLLVRADLLRRLGGYDERFAPAYYEDTDLCFAARAAGFLVFYQPRARVMHHEGVSHGTDVTSGIKSYQEVNRVKFCDKWAAELARQAVSGSVIVRRACDRRQGPGVLVLDRQLPSADNDAASPRMLLLLRGLVALGCRVRFLAQDHSRMEPHAGRLGQFGIEVLSVPGGMREILDSLAGDVELTIVSRPEVAAEALPLVRECLPGSKVVYSIPPQQVLDPRESPFSTGQDERPCLTGIPCLQGAQAPASRDVRAKSPRADIGDDDGPRADRGGETGVAACLPGAPPSTRESELALIRSADAALAATEHERCLVLAAAPGARVHVVPDVQASLRSKTGFAERNGLLLAGRYLHAEHEDAVLYFHRLILPRIRCRLPEVVLHLVGHPVLPNIEALASPLVRVHGWVEDPSELYERCRVSLAPLRFGAGMKGNVGESMLRGLPVVTTSVGAEGLHLTNRVDALVADDALTFADAVVRLYTDAALWQQLADRGARHIAASYGPAAVAHHLAAVFEELALSGRQSAAKLSRRRVCVTPAGKREAAGLEATIAAILNDQESENSGISAAFSDREKHVAAMSAAFSDREKHSAALAAALGDRERCLATLTAALDDRERHIVTLTAARSDRENRIDQLTAEVARLDALWRGEAENSRRQRRVFEQSRSWRLTAPLRGADRFVRLVAPLLNPGAAAQLPALLAIRHNRQFDADYYRSRNRDLGAFGKAPFLHWLLWGAAEGRNPNSWFDIAWYRRTYPDVAASRLNPLVHYLRHGLGEGRQPNPEGIPAAAPARAPDHEPPGLEPRHRAAAAAVSDGNALPAPGRIMPAKVELPRALVIDSRWPQPDRDAGSVEAMNLVVGLNDLGYRVVFAAMVDDEADAPYRSDLERIGVLCLSPSAGPALDDFLRAEGKDLDVCVLYRVHSGGAYFETVRRHAGGARIVFNTVDLHGVREAREAVLKGDARARTLADATKEREFYLVRQADATIVVSSVERRLLEQVVPGACVFVLPLARDTRAAVAGYDARSGVGFIGGFAHAPNVDAVQFFVTQVWPLVLRELPECEFTIVGAGLPDGILDEAGRGVRYLGHLPDIAPWFGGLRVSVAPLRFGAGAKGKVASSLAYGVPCVVTPIGAEGMGLRDGLDILVGETPEALAARIVEVATTKTTWERQSAAGLAFVRRELSLQDWQRKLGSLLETIGLPPSPAADRTARRGRESRP